LADDAALAAAVVAGKEGPLAVAAGDLHRAVGAPSSSHSAHVVDVDLLEVTLDGDRRFYAVAHVVARRGWWRGRLVAVCNVDYVGEWNVAPRAHPNDGRADVLDVAPDMGLRARWQARRRLAQGTHVPHPHIAGRSVRQATFEFDREMRVWVDGVDVGRARRIDVSVRPDAFELHV